MDRFKGTGLGDPLDRGRHVGRRASTTVTVSFNAGANGLAAGPYTDTVTFTNTTNGNGNITLAISGLRSFKLRHIVRIFHESSA